MGALHEGHMRLIREAKENSNFVVCSIFVNPTQFNDPKDLEKYPRTIERDLKQLELAGCDLVFTPEVKEIYPDAAIHYDINLGMLDNIMEGKYRKDHFKGVAMIVERLFDIIKPDKAFFGLKDFQQLAVIKKLVSVRNIQTEIIPVEIVRNKEGLALSSRNQLLSDSQQKDALIIYKTLVFGKELLQKTPSLSVEELRQAMINHFSKGNLRLEYLEIVDNHNLLAAQDLSSNVSCCIAAICGEIRLIDNIQLA